MTAKKKPFKVYREPKVCLTAWKNKNKKGAEYFIFTLQIYAFTKPSPIHLRRHHILQLKKILNQIDIKEEEDEE